MSKYPLKLSELPMMQPPRDGWDVIEASLPERRQRLRIRSGLAAAAALFVVAVSATMFFSMRSDLLPAAPDQTALERLVTISQRMEDQLAKLRQSVSTLPSSQAILVAELEDMVAVLDQQLGQSPDSEQLWYQRVTLLTDLLGVYAMQTHDNPALMASL